MNASLTIDCEQDMPPFFESFMGMEEGLPKIIEILEKFDVKATFFVTAEVCEKFPDNVREVAKKHEIASHGFRHEGINNLDSSSMKETISKATNLIKELVGKRPTGFRVPRLRVNRTILQALRDLGYMYDSSISVWRPWQEKYLIIARELGIKELQIAIDDTLLRVPFGLELAKTQFFRDPLIILMHPWNAIGINQLKPRARFQPPSRIHVFWNSIGAGRKFLSNLRSLISTLQEKEVKFLRMMDL